MVSPESIYYRGRATHKIDKLGMDLWKRNDMVGGTRRCSLDHVGGRNPISVKGLNFTVD